MLVVSEYTPHEGRAGFEEDERVFVVSDERVRLGSVVAVVDEQHFLEVILHVAVDGALVEALLDTELLTFDYGFTLLVERNVRLVPKADVEQEQREHQNQHKHYDILVGALRQPLADLRLLGNLRALVRVRFLLLLGALLLELERDGLRLLVELDEAQQAHEADDAHHLGGAGRGLGARGAGETADAAVVDAERDQLVDRDRGVDEHPQPADVRHHAHHRRQVQPEVEAEQLLVEDPARDHELEHEEPHRDAGQEREHVVVRLLLEDQPHVVAEQRLDREYRDDCRQDLVFDGDFQVPFDVFDGRQFARVEIVDFVFSDRIFID